MEVTQNTSNQKAREMLQELQAGKGENVTWVYAANAESVFLPQMLIFPRKGFPSIFMQGAK